MTSQALERVQEGHSLVLTINRPDSRNAVDPSLYEALNSELERLESAKANGPRAVILRANGPVFLSGGNLKFIRDRPREESLEMCRQMRGLLNGIEASRVPWIAVIEGDVYGGGCEFILACDYRIAATHTRFSFKQAAMGLITGWGGGQRLCASLKRGAATRLLLAAETLKASAALELGLVDEVMAPGELMPRALNFVEAISACAPEAVSAFKALLHANYHSDTDTACREEEARFEKLWGGPAHQEAIDAFFAKRIPQWPKKP